MIKLNCWEVKQCGRQPNGDKIKELGICPVTTAGYASGINHGVNAGRACWAIAGTLCGGKIQGSYAQKLGNCLKCDFFNQVRHEEGDSFMNSREILKQINGKLPK